jgi:hypothetical protein
MASYQFLKYFNNSLMVFWKTGNIYHSIKRFKYYSDKTLIKKI